MSKLAAAIAAHSSAKGAACVTGVLLRVLPPAEAADLRAALKDATIPCTAISRGLSTIGHVLGSTSLQRHRRGDCHCEASA